MVKQNPTCDYPSLWVHLTLISFGSPSFICAWLIGLFKLHSRSVFLRFHWLDWIHFKSSHVHLFLDDIFKPEAHSHNTPTPTCPIHDHVIWSFLFLFGPFMCPFISHSSPIPHYSLVFGYSSHLHCFQCLDDLHIGLWSIKIHSIMSFIHGTFKFTRS